MLVTSGFLNNTPPGTQNMRSNYAMLVTSGFPNKYVSGYVKKTCDVSSNVMDMLIGESDDHYNTPTPFI